MIKLVVFDWNGVLIADTQAILDTDNDLLRSLGRRPISMQKYRDIFTMPVKDFFFALGFTEAEMRKDAKKIQETFHRLYEPRAARLRTRGGARYLLAWLKSRGISATILSNHTKEGLKVQLNRLGIAHYFDKVITNDKHQTMAQKNKAVKLRDLVKKSGLKRSEILIIGDSPEEVEAGRAAGVRTVSLTGGYYSTKRLEKAKPDHLIHTLTRLIDIIKKV
ncbi:hypothetical protein A3H16_00945 [Candidatus Kaiserbacteria bacterium RIFCSPLOWO2_12_FULL_53_8]|uniref:HAD family hydrolase n=2 Tax=Candidatus Kaiseribacteriota TaxID=1752734 RepID=A0A1F6CUS1_9BACT|nr:MAG: hypothetical protein A2851_04480 [Candidatus Kaiserbacteria bacterium RIFCSPHIGHO2_01_FULL_53_29]OGG92250.1 MAG: hypothetical protein A3H16_00945 [Candidatus Kaiserbacteria bacterium RIFCSPLOWO2_12_FULL_53_8]